MLIQITVKIKPDYHCSYCTAIAIGTNTYTIEAYSNIDLESKLNKIQANPPVYGIPIGWASYGVKGIRCSSCIN